MKLTTEPSVASALSTTTGAVATWEGEPVPGVCAGGAGCTGASADVVGTTTWPGTSVVFVTSVVGLPWPVGTPLASVSQGSVPVWAAVPFAWECVSTGQGAPLLTGCSTAEEVGSPAAAELMRLLAGTPAAEDPGVGTMTLGCSAEGAALVTAEAALVTAEAAVLVGSTGAGALLTGSTGAGTLLTGSTGAGALLTGSTGAGALLGGTTGASLLGWAGASVDVGVGTQPLGDGSAVRPQAAAAGVMALR